jgi:DNA-nicking Smr family endonuclease
MAKGAGKAPVFNDRAVWAAAMRDVIPLPGRRAPAPPPLSANDPPPAADRPTAAESRSVQAEPPPSAPFAGIDRANAERLKRGLRPIEARLDLHGRTQAEAHRELIDFVEASYRGGRRCVLVVTGRGLGPDGPGVLKSAVPRWLAEIGLRRRILAVAAAQPRHGGAGALYLLLRRQR